MKVEIPDYNNGQRSYTNEVHVLELDEEDYCKTINDCLKKIYDFYKIESMALSIRKVKAFDPIIEEITEKTGNGKLIQMFVDEINDYKKYLNIFTKEMNDGALSIYKKKTDMLLGCKKSIILKENEFMKQNKEAILEAINADKNEVIMILRKKKATDNKRYYANKKEVLGIVPRVKKTPEEVMEAKREAARKFYYKNKELEKSNKSSEDENEE